MKIILFPLVFLITLTKIITLKLDIHRVNDIVQNPRDNMIVNNNVIVNYESNNVSGNNNLFRSNLFD